MSLKSKIFIVLFICFFLNLGMSSLVVVLTPSIDKVLLFVDFIDKKSEKNDYVSYNINSKIIGKERITKKVACVSGDLLSVVNRDYFCNGVFLGTAKKISRNGVKLNMEIKETTYIPEGYSYIKGTHIDSYDSRYFGLVKNENLVKLISIF